MTKCTRFACQQDIANYRLNIHKMQYAYSLHSIVLYQSLVSSLYHLVWSTFYIHGPVHLWSVGPVWSINYTQPNCMTKFNSNYPLASENLFDVIFTTTSCSSIALATAKEKLLQMLFQQCFNEILLPGHIQNGVIEVDKVLECVYINETKCLRHTMELLANGNGYCSLHILYGNISLKRNYRIIEQHT